MGSTLSKAPVFYALAHIQFSQNVPMLGFQLQPFMESMGWGSSQQDSHDLMGISPPANLGEEPRWHKETVSRWSFSNANRDAGFLILPNAIVYQTTAYSTWTHMLTAIKDAIAKVVEIVPNLLVTRIGLRYLDAIVPQKGEQLSTYLIPQMVGMVEKLASVERPVLLQTLNEFTLHTGNGLLVNKLVAAHVTSGQVLFPVELLPLTLELADRFKNIEGLVATMDTDHFEVLEQPIPLVVESVSEKLNRLKDGLDEMFSLVATPEGIEKWK